MVRDSNPSRGRERKSSTPAVELTQPSVQWVPGHKSDQLPPSSAEIKNEWSYTSYHQYMHAWRGRGKPHLYLYFSLTIYTWTFDGKNGSSCLTERLSARWHTSWPIDALFSVTIFCKDLSRRTTVLIHGILSCSTSRMHLTNEFTPQSYAVGMRNVQRYFCASMSSPTPGPPQPPQTNPY